MKPRLIIVMGVSGSGKSTIAEALAKALNVDYLDADDYHSASNVQKMSASNALNDEDRWPWLENFAHNMAQQQGVVVGACSSLKKSYREHLRHCAEEAVQFVYLNGTKDLILKRMQARENHFMPSQLLDSQFSDLEIPINEDNVLTINIDQQPKQVIDSIVNQLN